MIGSSVGVSACACRSDVRNSRVAVRTRRRPPAVRGAAAGRGGARGRAAATARLLAGAAVTRGPTATGTTTRRSVTCRMRTRAVRNSPQNACSPNRSAMTVTSTAVAWVSHIDGLRSEPCAAGMAPVVIVRWAPEWRCAIPPGALNRAPPSPSEKSRWKRNWLDADGHGQPPERQAAGGERYGGEGGERHAERQRDRSGSGSASGDVEQGGDEDRDSRGEHAAREAGPPRSHAHPPCRRVFGASLRNGWARLSAGRGGPQRGSPVRPVDRPCRVILCEWRWTRGGAGFWWWRTTP